GPERFRGRWCGYNLKVDAEVIRMPLVTDVIRWLAHVHHPITVSVVKPNKSPLAELCGVSNAGPGARTRGKPIHRRHQVPTVIFEHPEHQNSRGPGFCDLKHRCRHDNLLVLPRSIPGGPALIRSRAAEFSQFKAGIA